MLSRQQLGERGIMALQLGGPALCCGGGSRHLLCLRMVIAANQCCTRLSAASCSENAVPGAALSQRGPESTATLHSKRRQSASSKSSHIQQLISLAASPTAAHIGGGQARGDGGIGDTLLCPCAHTLQFTHQLE